MESFDYVCSDELNEALKVVEITGRPLLVKGEPGTGKTQLAHHVAAKMQRPLFHWPIKSTSLAREGAYFYDAVSRLNDSRFQESGNKVHQIENYIHYGPLGKAFASTQPSVLLIDEIDKADIEFPNDLLLELDQMQFIVVETQQCVQAIHRPLVIITSNSEKELPDAFMRRCIFHYIDFPSLEMMRTIVKSHYPHIDQQILQQALQSFYKLREREDLKKKPSTSELIDWIQILLHEGGQIQWSKGESLPYLGALIKHEDDLLNLKKHPFR